MSELYYYHVVHKGGECIAESAPQVGWLEWNLKQQVIKESSK